MKKNTNGAQYEYFRAVSWAYDINIFQVNAIFVPRLTQILSSGTMTTYAEKSFVFLEYRFQEIKITSVEKRYEMQTRIDSSVQNCYNSIAK